MVFRIFTYTYTHFFSLRSFFFFECGSCLVEHELPYVHQNEKMLLHINVSMVGTSASFIHTQNISSYIWQSTFLGHNHKIYYRDSFFFCSYTILGAIYIYTFYVVHVLLHKQIRAICVFALFLLHYYSHVTSAQLSAHKNIYAYTLARITCLMENQ